MANPWEKYQKPTQAPPKPWEKYASTPSNTGQNTENSAPQEEKDWLQNAKENTLKGLGYAGKGLDYLGGITRTAGAYPFVKEVSGQDVLNAFKANPLSGQEILKRGGVLQGKSLSDVVPSMYSPTGDEWLKWQKGGWADPTKRGAEGLALEIATDPLSMGGLAARGVAKGAAAAGRALTPAEKLVQYGARPVGAGLEDLGKTLYKSGFKKVDQVADQFNKIPASEVLFNEGITGTNKAVAKKSNALIDNLRRQQSQILAEVDKKVPAANVDEALKPLRERIAAYEASKDPVKMEAAQALKDDLQTYEALKARPAQSVSTQVPSSILDAQGRPVMNTVTENIPSVIPPTPSQLSGMKSTVQNSIPQKAWKEGAMTNAEYMSGRKDLGRGLRAETENLATQASPELGQALKNTNAKMGSLLSVGNTLDQEAMKGINKNIITSVDPIVMALEHGGAMLPAKKAIDLSKTTWFRTNAGRGLYDLGNYGDLMLRRPSVWQDIYNQQPQGDSQ